MMGFPKLEDLKRTRKSTVTWDELRGMRQRRSFQHVGFIDQGFVTTWNGQYWCTIRKANPSDYARMMVVVDSDSKEITA